MPLNIVAREVLEGLIAEDSDYLFLNERTGRNIGDIKRAFTSACRVAEIDNLTFHDLRHTFATRLKDVGVDSITRRDLLGHASTEMSDAYTHSPIETKQSAVDALTEM